MVHAVQVNKNLHFEVFIHKVDGLADEVKLEVQREIHMLAMQSLHDVPDSLQIRSPPSFSHHFPPPTHTHVCLSFRKKRLLSFRKKKIVNF